MPGQPAPGPPFQLYPPLGLPPHLRQQYLTPAVPTGTAAANVTFDAVAFGSTTTSTTALSWTHTCGPGATYLVVAIDYDTNVIPTTLTVTYNGVAMTRLGSQANGAPTGYMFGLRNPGTGSAFTVAAAATGGSSDAFIGGSMSFIGGVGAGVFASTSGTSLRSAITVPATTAGNLVAAAVAVGDNILSTADPATARFVDNVLHSGGNTTGNLAAATNPSTGGAVTTSWGNTGAADTWLAMAVEVLAPVSASISGTAHIAAVPAGVSTMTGVARLVATPTAVQGGKARIAISAIPAMVQEATLVNQTPPGTSLALAFGANVTAGNLLVAFVGMSAGGLDPSAVNDTVGSTWAKAVNQNAPSGVSCESVWWALAHASGANTVTLTVTSGEPGGFHIMEFSGVAASGTVDATSSNTVTSGAGVAPSLSGLSGSHDLVTYWSGHNVASNTATGGIWTDTARDVLVSGPNGFFQVTYAATGPTVTGPTLVPGTTASFNNLVVAFKAGTVTGTTSTVSGRTRLSVVVASGQTGRARVQVVGLTTVVSGRTRVQVVGLTTVVPGRSRLQVIGLTNAVTGRTRFQVIGRTTTVTGRARLANTFTSGISGRTRAQVVGLSATVTGVAHLLTVGQPTATIAGRARLQVVGLSATVAGHSRLARSFGLGIAGRSRVQVIGLSATEAGRGRVQVVGLSSTVAGRTRVQVVGLTATVAGRSRLSVLRSATVTGLAHLLVVGQPTVAVTGVTRVQVVGLATTVPGRGRLARSFGLVEPGRTRLSAALGLSQPGRARLSVSVLATELGRSRLSAVEVATVAGRARIATKLALGIAGRTRVQVTGLSVVGGRARLAVVATSTVSGVAHILVSGVPTVTIVGRTRVQVIGLGTAVVGRSRLNRIFTAAVTGRSRLAASPVATVVGQARLRSGVTSGQGGLGRISRIFTLTVGGRARLTGAGTVATVAGRARVRVVGLSVVVAGQARLGVGATATVTGRSRLVIRYGLGVAGRARVTTTVAVGQPGRGSISGLRASVVAGRSRVIIGFLAFAHQGGRARVVPVPGVELGNVGPPQTHWRVGEPETHWSGAEPITHWRVGEPETGWVVGPPTTDWRAGGPE